MKPRLLIATLIIATLVHGACGGGTTPATGPAPDEPAPALDDPWLDEIITVVDPGGTSREFSVRDLRELDATTQEITRETDDGVQEFRVTGVLLETLCSQMGVEPGAVIELTLAAGDGYAVSVPRDVLAAHTVIFAYEIDGEPLAEGTAPLRAYLPGSETMYWARNLVRIEFHAGSQAAPTTDAILFLETIFAHAGLQRYGDTDRALRTSELLAYAGSGDYVFMGAADGFGKVEQRDIFARESIVTSGDAAPAFRGPDLPRGMHVRDLVWLIVGDTAFYSVRRGPELYDTVTVGDENGVSLALLAGALQLAEAQAYVLEAADGYSVQIDGNALGLGVVYIRDSGEVSSAFDELPSSTSIRDLLSIRVARDDEVAGDTGTEPGPEPVHDPWIDEVITVASPDGTAREFTVGQLRAMDATTETITPETDVGVQEFVVTGVLLEVLCTEIGVDAAAVTELNLTAGDGYAVHVPASVLGDHTLIFAYEIDGQPLKEGTAPLRAYPPGSETMYWARNLVHIELK